MSRSIESSVPAGVAALNPRACEALGTVLGDTRTTKGLTIRDVADRLLLSTRQVRALESFDVKAFHNARFYATALKKYAGLLGIDALLVSRAVDDSGASFTAERDQPIAKVLEPLPAVPRVTAAAVLDVTVSEPPARGRWLAVVVVGMLLLGGAAAAYVMWPPSTSVDADQAVASQPTLPAVTPPPAAASSLTPEATAVKLGSAPDAPAGVPPTALGAAATSNDAVPPAAPGRSGAFGAVKVTTATWIYLRYATGDIVERNLREGEVVTFDAAPIYLALGTPDVELTLGEHSIDTTPFIVNGQVRMRAADLALDTGR